MKAFRKYLVATVSAPKAALAVMFDVSWIVYITNDSPTETLNLSFNAPDSSATKLIKLLPGESLSDVPLRITSFYVWTGTDTAASVRALGLL